MESHSQAGFKTVLPFPLAPHGTDQYVQVKSRHTVRTMHMLQQPESLESKSLCKLVHDDAC